jgi:hypothetical protein
MPAGDAEHKISMRGLLSGFLCLLLLQLSSVEKTYSVTPIDHYKLFAHSLIIDSKEYRCIDQLWTKESNWSITAFNRSGAYGIPQLKNAKLKTMDGYTQVQWGYRYIIDRYQTPCNAWAYWLKHGNY